MGLEEYLTYGIKYIPFRKEEAERSDHVKEEVVSKLNRKFALISTYYYDFYGFIAG